MKRFLKALWTEDKAENMPEYALLLFFISLTSVSAMGAVATRVNKIYLTASVHMTTASNPELVGAPTIYAGQIPASPDLHPKEASQAISR
ncbi:MAG TPA: hypothetical protein VFZ27_13445 [Terriglobia bacterium]|nr:hypothetical protein [Terriglobia bacterium]